ncbi:hypothetical protein KP509_19G033000 [Ceratopteris richardii]|uniref:Uncharacterized protein n=1 Tax=Ceratopteris richardii TaxID=49495 RepID=A0A8T2SMR6_CERRI|nr:hypothetical protein KP509_19G033000 [Ceratopteris richardii]KAH7352165.1 hypothetical protein KP509_19G033000 [Ceratopteris richardii]KAH7352166.1 hypothetical protein KP509_19G033000 [Ceratopteris richardii]
MGNKEPAGWNTQIRCNPYSSGRRSDPCYDSDPTASPRPPCTRPPLYLPGHLDAGTDGYDRTSTGSRVCDAGEGGSRRRPSNTLRKKEAESKRRRRVAKYKSFAVEARMKDSLKKGLLWVKRKYLQGICNM